jgi:trimethylamine--corrinoid protein Co-methyltransferase
MIHHPRAYLEQLSPDDCDRIDEGALDVLARVGMRIESADARRLLSEAGARVESEAERAFFPPGLIIEALALTPRRWTLRARNRGKDVEVGGRTLLVSPGYGSPFVADASGARRSATLSDLTAFATLAEQADVIDITGGVLVEPSDVPPSLRALEITYALIKYSGKPFFGSVAGREGAQESLRMAQAVFGRLENPVMMALININSPLRLDARMAEALVEYAKAGQPVLLTPGILMGVTAPVTAVGALTQACAELLGCVAVAQAVRPGAPVIIGTGGFGADLRSAGPGFGRPENALGTIRGAQMARHLGLPYRCSGAVTGAMLPDCRSGYERMMTAFSAWAAGAHVCLQAAGTLDAINSMSYEQFVIDTEIWGYIKRVAAPPVVSADTLATDVIASPGEGYLGHEHTIRHMRRELFSPSLIPVQSYEDWLASGGKDVVAQASARVEAVKRVPLHPPDDPALADLESYVTARRSQWNRERLIADPTSPHSQ